MEVNPYAQPAEEKVVVLKDVQINDIQFIIEKHGTYYNLIAKWNNDVYRRSVGEKRWQFLKPVRHAEPITLDECISGLCTTPNVKISLIIIKWLFQVSNHRMSLPYFLKCQNIHI